jgi:hypothetical protein
MTTIYDRKLSRVDSVPNNLLDESNVDFHPSCERICPIMLYLFS